MAVLSETDRQAASDEMEERLSRDNEPISIGRQDLKAAVDAADGWVNANAASFNNALPALAKSNLTAKQKAELLIYVVRRRWEVA